MKIFFFEMGLILMSRTCSLPSQPTFPTHPPTHPLGSGLGALLVRRDALPALRRRYFSGGTVAVSLADEPFHRCSLFGCLLLVCLHALLVAPAP